MSQTEDFDIKTEADFQLLMENVDKELKEKDLAIFQRPIKAWFNISSRYRLGLQLNPQRKVIVEGSYTGDDLTLRIFRWYEEKYGERLKVDNNWKVAMLIKQDLYKLKIPKIYPGKVLFIAPRDISEIQIVYPNIAVGEATKVNIFNLIEDITPNLITSFTNRDVENIMIYCRLGTETRIQMEKHKSMVLIKQAISDISAAVSHLFETQPNWGLSKWASLQASEKIIKAFIQTKGKPFPKGKDGHNLPILASQAESLGLSTIDSNIIKIIQCNAGVRYGTPQVNLFESIQAHHASLIICNHVAEQM